MDCVERFSFEQRVDASALQKLAMLHLPRFDASELAHRDLIPAEIERLALRAARLLDGYRPMTGIPHLGPLRKADVQVHELSESLAHIIHERFHYLGSARQGVHLRTVSRRGAGAAGRDADAEPPGCRPSTGTG